MSFRCQDWLLLLVFLAAADFKPAWCLAGSVGEQPDAIRVLLTSCYEAVFQVRFTREEWQRTPWQISAILLAAPDGAVRALRLPTPRLRLKRDDIARLRFERPR